MRELFDITVEEIVELLKLCKLLSCFNDDSYEERNTLLENNDVELLNDEKSKYEKYHNTSYLGLLNEKYLILKTIINDEKELCVLVDHYFCDKDCEIESIRTDHYTHYFYIKSGFVRNGLFDGYEDIIPVLEWFLSKGFKVGNLTLIKDVN